MSVPPPSESVIAVLGLGYVGLPLATALAGHFDVVGYDSDPMRVAELASGRDRTGEVAPEILRSTSLRFTADDADLAEATYYIVTVPTPVNGDNRPDLSAVCAASRTVGGVLAPGNVVVYESTVYPGVTEDVCGAELAGVSGLACGADFFLGYSPERINPGDRRHTIDRITKVVAGQTAGVADRLVELYGAVTGGNVFVARDIRTAEAAKVIENAQRDINIAFINEVTMIFNRLGISVYDVLEAARTKWNFLDFRPGLVGGHCIGVDPFYLAHCAEVAGHNPEIILAGRRINDSMSLFLSRRVRDVLAGLLGGDRPARILVLGLTFKENVPDLRNSKVVDVVRDLRDAGHAVDVHDPVADPGAAEALYGIRLLDGMGDGAAYDAVIGAVSHDAYRSLADADVAGLLASPGLVADFKGMWRGRSFGDGISYWQP